MKWTNLVVVSILSIMLPSDISILNLYNSWNLSLIMDDCKFQRHLQSSTIKLKFQAIYSFDIETSVGSITVGSLRPPAPPFTAIFIYVQNPWKRHVSLCFSISKPYIESNSMLLRWHVLTSAVWFYIWFWYARTKRNIFFPSVLNINENYWEGGGGGGCHNKW